MTPEEYVKLYKKLHNQVKDRDVALGLLSEIRRDEREALRLLEPATAKQKGLMRQLGIVFKETIISSADKNKFCIEGKSHRIRGNIPNNHRNFKYQSQNVKGRSKNQKYNLIFWKFT